VEGQGHVPLDFMRPFKNLLPTSVGLQWIKTRLKTQENQCWSRTPSFVTRRRRSIGVLGFEKMGVASWHI
jgi:hypothetical protein